MQRDLARPAAPGIMNKQENENIDSLLFLGKHPESGSQEKILNSIGKVIKNGNLEFTQIRIDENGKVIYT